MADTAEIIQLKEDANERIRKAHTEAYANGYALGAEMERARIREILTCPEAIGVKDHAEHLAFRTDFSAGDAKAELWKFRNGLKGQVIALHPEPSTQQ